MSAKSSIRKKVLAERAAKGSIEFETENALILKNIEIVLGSLYKKLDFTINNLNRKRKKLGLYLPVKGEPDLTSLMSYNNSIIALPKIVSKEKMWFVYYERGAYLEKNLRGFMQPVADVELIPEIVIVPGLAFSLQGYRLGFGVGYYDRYLAGIENKGRVIKIGVCFNKYLLEYLPVENHDIKLDYIVTDKLILKL